MGGVGGLVLLLMENHGGGGRGAEFLLCVTCGVCVWFLELLFVCFGVVVVVVFLGGSYGCFGGINFL